MDNPAEYIWVLIPLGGLAVGAFAIYQGSASRRAAMEVLKTYAQQGKEPPKDVLDAVARATSDDGGPMRGPARLIGEPHLRRTSYFARFVFMTVLAAGFGAAAWWWPGLRFPFFIVAFCVAAVAASSLVWALTTPKNPPRDDQ